MGGRRHPASFAGAGKGRDIARRVLTEGLSGDDRHIDVWPTSDDGTPRVPSTVKTFRTNYVTNSVGSGALSSVDGDRAVGTAHIQDNALAKRHVPNSLIDNDLLGGTSVSTGKIQANAVNGDKLASDPHGIDPLGNANVNNDTNRAVGGAHIRTKAIQSYHLADDAVGNRVANLSYTDLKNKPNLSKYLTSNDIAGKAGKQWVKDYVRSWARKNLKPTAFKGG